jgi:alpha-beta hydrolase superfamily lysophospholipase
MPPRTRSARRDAPSTRTKASIADVSTPEVEVASRVVRVGPRKVPAEFINIPADASIQTPKYDLVIVPGNPGVPSFYEHYAKTLHTLLGGDVDIEIFGYKGHTTDRHADTTGDWFTLRDQHDHLREYLRMRKPRSTNGTVLVGHSIGAELCLAAMDKLGTDAVRGVVGLMPFVLVNAQSTLQKFLSALVPHQAAGVPGRIDRRVPRCAPRVLQAPRFYANHGVDELDAGGSHQEVAQAGQYSEHGVHGTHGV